MKAIILIVEDSPLVSKPLKLLLEEMGYSVMDIVESGEEALKRLDQLRPDLLLMDIKLSGELDGIQTAVEIRKKYDIPVIYSTAYTDENLIERAKITNPFGYILKPYHKRELRTIIEMALFNHKTETKLKESEKRFRLLTMNSSDIINIIDKSGHIIFETQATKRILGYEPGSRINSLFLDYVHQEDKERISEFLNSIIEETETSNSVEYRFQHGNGDWKYMETFFHNLLSEPVIKGIVINSRDITDRREAELAKKQALIERNNSALAIAATTSHEINQPLMILQANLEMLQMNLPEELLKGKNVKYMNNISNSIRRIQDILELINNAQTVRFDSYSEDIQMVVFEEDSEE
ncbi:MAG: response regulator [Candidatus Cloacimonetes bacterium]|nr:response regulator [Candidatus Cloacimonadota bacterium]